MFLRKKLRWHGALPIKKSQIFISLPCRIFCGLLSNYDNKESITLENNTEIEKVEKIFFLFNRN